MQKLHLSAVKKTYPTRKSSERKNSKFFLYFCGSGSQTFFVAARLEKCSGLATHQQYEFKEYTCISQCFFYWWNNIKKCASFTVMWCVGVLIFTCQSNRRRICETAILIFLVFPLKVCWRSIFAFNHGDCRKSCFPLIIRQTDKSSAAFFSQTLGTCHSMKFVFSSIILSFQGTTASKVNSLLFCLPGQAIG